jgi:hypothetical protein
VTSQGEQQETVVSFSNWIPWDNRDSLPAVDKPGVYLLAIFPSLDDMPSGEADALAREIIYIGETCKNSLTGRWYQFERSAFLGKNGHSGGWTYREKYGNTASQLYMAAFPVDIGNKTLQPLFVRYVERKLIWEYARKWGKAPSCNQK